MAEHCPRHLHPGHLPVHVEHGPRPGLHHLPHDHHAHEERQLIIVGVDDVCVCECVVVSTNSDPRRLCVRKFVVFDPVFVLNFKREIFYLLLISWCVDALYKMYKDVIVTFRVLVYIVT